MFQAPQGYPVLHRFANRDKITLNDIEYQIQGNTLYAIDAKQHLITGEILIRTQSSKSSVAIRFTTPLSESQLFIDNGSLSINHLTLRHLRWFILTRSLFRSRHCKILYSAQQTVNSCISDNAVTCQVLIQSLPVPTDSAPGN